MRRILISAVMAVAATVLAQAPPNCNGVRNESPILDLPAQPLKTVPNGQSWKMENGTNVVYIAKLKGSAYEMGYAFGQLYGSEININMGNMLIYGKNKITSLLERFGVPEFMGDYIWTQFQPLLFLALDWNFNIARPYIPQRYLDELQGIADGANGTVDGTLLRRINMLPELIQAACTITGAYGEATADGKLYHLRALDWEPTANVNQFPSIIFYDSNEPGSHQFANIGYMGLIGSLTAISKTGISVGEKVMYNRKGTYPVEPHITYVGKPWMMVLRDTVQFANNLEDISRTVLQENRTMMIHLGWGSLPDKAFHGMDYSANMVNIYDDKNYTFYSDVHPQLNGLFFYDKQVQPSGNPCLGNILKAAHGKITPETLFRDVAGYHQTGDAQVIVMDPEGQQIWATWSQYNSPIDAYTRSPMHIRLSDFWTADDAKPTGFLE